MKQYVQLLGRGIVGVSAKDGKLLWNYNRVANGTANIPTPIVQDDYVFCSTGYDAGAALLKLEKKGSGINAREVYFLPAKTLQNHHGGMVLIGDHVYCGHGHNNGFPICVELKTGKVAWSKGRGPGTRLGRRGRRRWASLFPIRERRDGPDRSHARRLQRKGDVQDSRLPRSKLAAPRRRRRQALPPRAGRTVVLFAQGQPVIALAVWGEWLTLWTIRLSVAAYVLALALNLLHSPWRRARLWWSVGCAMCLAARCAGHAFPSSLESRRGLCGHGSADARVRGPRLGRRHLLQLSLRGDLARRCIVVVDLAG